MCQEIVNFIISNLSLVVILTELCQDDPYLIKVLHSNSSSEHNIIYFLMFYYPVMFANLVFIIFG